MQSNEYTDPSPRQRRIDLRTTSKGKAQKIIETQDVLTLNNGERDRFLSLLEKPAKPNTTLKSAMREYLRKR